MRSCTASLILKSPSHRSFPSDISPVCSLLMKQLEPFFLVCFPQPQHSIYFVFHACFTLLCLLVTFDFLHRKNMYLYIISSYMKCLTSDHFLTYKTGSFPWLRLIHTRMTLFMPTQRSCGDLNTGLVSCNTIDGSVWPYHNDFQICWK